MRHIESSPLYNERAVMVFEAGRLYVCSRGEGDSVTCVGTFDIRPMREWLATLPEWKACPESARD